MTWLADSQSVFVTDIYH